MAGVTAVADAATSYSYAIAGAAYVPISVTVAGATSTASAPASTVVVTTNNLGSCTVNVSLGIRVACAIGNNVMFAPSGTNASAQFNDQTAVVA